MLIYRDMSGESLHRRGYRSAMHKASLNEAAAAGILQLAGWPAVVEEDPGAALLRFAVESNADRSHTSGKCCAGGPEVWKGHLCDRGSASGDMHHLRNPLNSCALSAQMLCSWIRCAGPARSSSRPRCWQCALRRVRS